MNIDRILGNREKQLSAPDPGIKNAFSEVSDLASDNPSHFLNIFNSMNGAQGSASELLPGLDLFDSAKGGTSVINVFNGVEGLLGGAKGAGGLDKVASGGLDSLGGLSDSLGGLGGSIDQILQLAGKFLPVVLKVLPALIAL